MVGIPIVTSADVSDGVDHALVGQDAIGINEVLEQLWIRRTGHRGWRLPRPSECRENCGSAQRDNRGQFEFRHKDFSRETTIQQLAERALRHATARELYQDRRV